MYAAHYGRADATCALLIAGAAEGSKDDIGYGDALPGEPRGHRTGRCAVQVDGGGLGKGERQGRGVRRRRHAGAAAGARNRSRACVHARAQARACV
jgi:hypothetical protein